MHLPEGRLVLIVLLDQLGLVLLLFAYLCRHLLGWSLHAVQLSLQFLHERWVRERIVEVDLEDCWFCAGQKGGVMLENLLHCEVSTSLLNITVNLAALLVEKPPRSRWLPSVSFSVN